LEVLGYICEIFSSYQGEGGSVIGSLFGRRQVFVRLSGCNLAQSGRGGCRFCDSPGSKSRDMGIARIETRPGSGEFTDVKNPLDVPKVVKEITRLETEDFHSISLSGGEPLWQPEFTGVLIEESKREGIKTYLETNGSLPKNLEELNRFPDYACVDIKDRSSGASKNWKTLVDRELETIDGLLKSNVTTFAKLVVTRDTMIEDVEMISRKLASLDCPLAIQPVTPVGDVRPPPIKQLHGITMAAAKHLLPENISLSVQMHKSLGIL
jgi:organic radical activating enzyme